MSMTLTAQNLSEYLWKNRVILIITNDIDSKIYTSQIQEFSASSEDFKERKLIIYSVLPKKHKLENAKENDWVTDYKLYSNYNPSNKTFQVVLLGLDGSIKLQQNSVLTTTKLFSKIDGMPMRRAELKNKK
jgi:hypothetical protein